MSFSIMTEQIPKLLGQAEVSWANINYNCPLANIRAGFTKIKEYFDYNQPNYDAISIALLNCDALIDDAAEHQYDPIAASFDEVAASVVQEDRMIPLDPEDHEMIINALKQMSDDNTSIIHITGANGAIYAFKIDDLNDPTSDVDMKFDNGTREPFIENGCISRYVYPINFFDAEVTPNERSLLTALLINNDCTPSKNLVQMRQQYHDLVDEHINPEIDVREQGVQLRTSSYKGPSSTLSLFSDLAASGEYNAAMSEVCSACLSADSDNQIMATFDKYSNATSGVYARVRSTLVNVKLAYANAGVRGVFSFLMNMFRATQSLTTADGVLIFTDNSCFMPQEFIAGAFTSMFVTIVNTISTILGSIRSVVTVLLSVVGFVATSLISAFAAEANAVYGSVLLTDSLNDDSILPYAALSMFHGEVDDDNTSDACKGVVSALTRYGAPIVIPVIGGCLIVGPGSFTSTGSIETLRYEFHPSVLLLSHSWHLTEWNNFLNSGSYERFRYNPTQLYRTIPYNGDYKVGWKWWALAELDHDLYNDSLAAALYYHAMNNCNDILDVNLDGTLSEYQDAQLRQGIALCSGLFLLFVLGADYQIYTMMDYPYILNVENAPVAPVDGSDWEAVLINVAIQWAAYQDSYWSGSPAAPSVYLSWEHLINCMNMTNLDVVTHFKLYNTAGNYINYSLSSNWLTVEDYTFFDNVELVYERDPGDLVFPPVTGFWYPVTSNITFGAIPPKWKASSFWRWTILAGVVATVAAAATAVVAISCSRWIKKKRALNKARFTQAQSAFEEAVQGKYTYVDDQGQIQTGTFDPSTSEGKAYINEAYKNYRKTSFSNNLWANLIGGSRYDVSSFWGEKDSVSNEEKAMDILKSYTDVTSSSDNPTTSGFDAASKIIHLIAGSDD